MKTCIYLDCGCCIDDDGKRTWCPTCAAFTPVSVGKKIDWAKVDARLRDYDRDCLRDEASRFDCPEDFVAWLLRSYFDGRLKERA